MNLQNEGGLGGDVAVVDLTGFKEDERIYFQEGLKKLLYEVGIMEEEEVEQKFENGVELILKWFQVDYNEGVLK